MSSVTNSSHVLHKNDGVPGQGSKILGREGNRCIDDRLANLGVEYKIEMVWLDALLSCAPRDFFCIVVSYSLVYTYSWESRWHKFETQLTQRNFKSNDAHNHIQDQDATPATELYSRARGQEEEILSLREQIAFACMKQELQLLNEKCKLERQFSELRMAVDEKQSEAISSASNDLARRKGYLEENLKLAHDLKASVTMQRPIHLCLKWQSECNPLLEQFLIHYTEYVVFSIPLCRSPSVTRYLMQAIDDERYIFMSSMLGLLAEYSLWPRVMNASSISSCVKGGPWKLHWLPQNGISGNHTPCIYMINYNGGFEVHIFVATLFGQDRIGELSSVLETRADNGNHVVESPGSGNLTSHNHNDFMFQHNFSQQNLIGNEQNHQSTSNMAGYMHPALNADVNWSIKTFNYQQISKADREVFPHGSIDKVGVQDKNMERNFVNSNMYQPQPELDETASSVSEDGPGIENFQISGDAIPGEKLLGCGYPVRGTSLCMFQWVRHLEDGTRHYIEGATNPEYVVTADDVDKLIAVECIPMDDKGRQGLLVGNKKKTGRIIPICIMKDYKRYIRVLDERGPYRKPSIIVKLAIYVQTKQFHDTDIMVEYSSRCLFHLYGLYKGLTFHVGSKRTLDTRKLRETKDSTLGSEVCTTPRLIQIVGSNMVMSSDTSEMTKKVSGVTLGDEEREDDHNHGVTSPSGGGGNDDSDDTSTTRQGNQIGW
ncbi:hypothetical protein V8G54_010872, partial [Vigna mungo]